MSGPNNSLESEKYLSDWNFDHLSANSFVDADVADVLFFSLRCELKKLKQQSWYNANGTEEECRELAIKLDRLHREQLPNVTEVWL